MLLELLAVCLLAGLLLLFVLLLVLQLDEAPDLYAEE
jgi:hypothetical protein